MPKISEVLAAERPMWSHHSGSRVRRRARAPEITATELPRVSSTNVCARSTVQTDAGAPRADRWTAPRSGIDCASSAALIDMRAAKPKVAARPSRSMSSAPVRGPITSPTRWLPPSVDRARARYEIGTESMTNPCRASRKTVQVAPVTVIRTAKSSRLSVSAAPAIATASMTPVISSARRSPTRATREPAGSEFTSWPTPIRATTSAAIPRSPPSSRARRATTGSTAPWPIALTKVGP